MKAGPSAEAEAPLARAAPAQGAGTDRDPAAADVEAAIEAGDTNAVASRITDVAVYSDRALIRREASVLLSSEPTVHAFRSLPGWVDDGSVRVTSSRGSVLDVRVVRRPLGSSDEPSLRAAERAHQALVSEAEALDDELVILESQKAHVESIQVFSVEKLSNKALTSDFSVARYGDVIDFVSGSLRETASATRQATARRAELEEQIQASAQRLAEMRSLTDLEETVVLVALKGNDREATEVALSYATPGATWGPEHELRTGDGERGSVELASFAVVTQTTGEDWSQAELTFSTQSFSQSQQIPDLEMLSLGDAPEGAHPTSSIGTSFGTAQQKFAAQSQQWNRRNHMASASSPASLDEFEAQFAAKMESLARVQREAVRVFDGLQRRGTTVHFTAADPVTVRSDGQGVRVPIGTHRLPARAKIVAAAEESLNAVFTLQMTHRGAEPLLPGPVSRFDGGAFLGVTDVEMVAPGEDFSMLFRVADHIKLSRALDRKRSSLVRGARNVMQLSFVTTVENLSDEATLIDIAERIPVARNPSIRVSRVEVTPAQRSDASGIVRWSLPLQAKQRREIRVSYQVDYPASLALDVQRHEPSPSPAAPRKRSLEEDLIELESQM